MTKVWNTIQKKTSISKHQKNRPIAQILGERQSIAPNPTIEHRRTKSKRRSSIYKKTAHEESTDDYSKRLILKPHKKNKRINLEPTHKREFTVQCIVDFLIQKYPDYRSYVDKALQYINPEVIIFNIREAECHINHICENMKLGFFQTMIVRNAVTSTLADRGMPK